LIQLAKYKHSLGSASSYPLYTCESIVDLSKKELNNIFKLFNYYGYLIIQSKDVVDPVSSLVSIGRYFGQTIHHNLSDSSGVHPIWYIPGFPEYANTTTCSVPMHTDGSFRDYAPKIMLAHCQIPADEGGYTRIALAKDVYFHLKTLNPDVLRGLFLKDAFTVKRDNREAEKPVFLRKNNQIQMFYRSGNDIKITIHPKAKKGYLEIESFLSNPDNYTEFRLEAGQTLILDNTRLLHGRTSFSENSQRRLYGLWCDGISEFSNMFDIGFQTNER
jgi:alpha-ketoglutarate-dependent taurine dioxygenase